MAVQNLLIMRLRELEGAEGGQSATVGELQVAALTQHELVTWYFDYQASRWGTARIHAITALAF